MSRFLGAGSICTLLMAGMSVSRADTMVLQSATPAEIVHLNAPTLNPAVNNVDGYAGVLNWLDTSVNPQKSFQSFCIDVNHDISLGGTYTYTVGGNVNTSVNGNGGDPLLTTTIIKQIYGLWLQHGTADLTSMTNHTAASFQVALWDILYNGGSANGSGPVTVSSGNGTIQTDITTGFGWANYAMLNPDTTNASFLDTMIFTSTNGQQQIYIGGPVGAPASTPLPRPFVGGLALLGILRLFNCRTRTAA